MPPSSPRDAFTFPLTAALWTLAGSVATSVANIGLALGRFASDSGLPDLVHNLLPALAAQGLMGALVLAVFVFVVAERRQSRAPERVGHARGAGAATGLIAAVGAWATASAVSALAFSQIAALQSPAGFAVAGAVVALLHLGAAAIGASVGAALMPDAGEAPLPARPSRHAWVGVAVFGATLAFGLELVISTLPSLLQDTLGTALFTSAPWPPLLALLIAAIASLGYAWRRRTAAAERTWSGDAWAALACLPISLAISAGIGVLTAVLMYAMGESDLPALLVAVLMAILIGGAALGGLGAVAGLVRTRPTARAA